MIRAFDTSIEQLDERLELIEKYIDSLYPPKDATTNTLFRSPLSYNAVIISLYSSYENFVDDILYEYINQIADRAISADELPTDIKTNNLKLSAEFLNSEQRFKNFSLDREEVINNIYSGKITNKILLKHGGNLSFRILSEHFKSLGIADLGNRIKKSRIYIDFYAKIKYIDPKSAEDYLSSADTETVFTTLNSLISQRNNIAHSWKSDDKVDFEIVRNEWIPFIKNLCRCLHEIVIINYIKWLLHYNKLFLLENFEIFGSSIVGFYGCKVDLNLTDKMVLKSDSNIRVFEIESIQHHNENDVSIKLANSNLKKEKSMQYSFYSFSIPEPPQENEDSLESTEKELVTC